MTDLLSPGQPVVEVHLMGHALRVKGPVDPVALDRAITRAEATFHDMEEGYALNWGCSPTALDTTTWLLMGVLNLAHQLVCHEQEADRHTQDLESTLSKLLDDVPDDLSSDPGPLFRG